MPFRLLLTRFCSVAVILAAWSAIGGVPGPVGVAYADGSLGVSVVSRGSPLSGYGVALFATGVRRDGVPLKPVRVGTGQEVKEGVFTLNFQTPAISDPVYYVLARRGQVVLISALGPEPLGSDVVVNERTTVAAGFAFAQFIQDAEIKGNKFGVANAVHMAANMADVRTGELGEVIRTAPNGGDTSTLATFNSLTNMVAFCVRRFSDCSEFLAAATPAGALPPHNTFEAIATIAQNPSAQPQTLFALSSEVPIYSPPLRQAPDAWTIFLRFTGTSTSRQTAFDLMNGPGNFAFDRVGNFWVDNNYIPQPRFKIACAGRTLLKFKPWGELFPGAPFSGGGLSGQGMGVALDPDSDVWISNFGFEAPECNDPDNPLRAKKNSVSQFAPDGTPLSPPEGYTANGTISWPQGLASNRQGDIFIANCRTHSATILPGGNPNQAREVVLPIADLRKPFGVAIDGSGRAWVTGNNSSTVAIIGPGGGVAKVIRGALNRPMGIAADTHGNMWVSNSGKVDVPCPPGDLRLGNGKPSIALFRPDGTNAGVFGGGGLTVPWGIAVDGDDTVWVANFGGSKVLDRSIEPYTNPRVSRFCGTSADKCPIGHQKTGGAISPESGYLSDALTRNTGIAIDPSGNVWIANNWKLVPLRINPGENAIVAMVGAAAPLRTPLIGLPNRFTEESAVLAEAASTVRVLAPADALEPLPAMAGAAGTGAGADLGEPVAPRMLSPDIVQSENLQPGEVVPQTIVPDVVEASPVR